MHLASVAKPIVLALGIVLPFGCQGQVPTAATPTTLPRAVKKGNSTAQQDELRTKEIVPATSPRDADEWLGHRRQPKN